MKGWGVWVPGHPACQGSKRAIPLKTGRTVMVEDNPQTKPWRNAVNDQARRFWEGPPLAGPVSVRLIFCIQPPKFLTKKRRAEGPITKRSGDVDKLTRAVLDGLTGVTFVDDSQVSRLVVDKCWANDAGPGVRICVSEKEV